MNMASTCHSSRQKDRVTLERIWDPVYTKLKEQQTSACEAHEELMRTHEHERKVLQELRNRRERLKIDLKDKSIAYQIDTTCLRKESSEKNDDVQKSKDRRLASLDKLPKAMPVSAR